MKKAEVIEIKWLRHAGFEMKIANKISLIDPSAEEFEKTVKKRMSAVKVVVLKLGESYKF